MADSVPVELTPDEFEPRVSRPHISFSQLSMFLRCSMQYKFRYVFGLKQPPVLRTAVGKGGHSALEYNGRHKMSTGQDLTIPHMLDMASTFIDIETDELEKEEKAGAGEAKDRALSSLRVYQTRDAPSVMPAGVEVEFNLDLNVENEEPIRIINGKIDLVTTDASVTDYKFVSQARTQAEVDLSPQLTLYGKVFKTLTGKYPKRLGYQMFLPGSTRTPPDSRAIERDGALMTAVEQEKRYTRIRHQFREVERAIANEHFIAVDDPKVCSWCGYRERCQGTSVDDFTAARVRGEG